MATTIKFLNLMDLINKYSSKIDIIKDKHLNLLSELSITSYLDTPLYFENMNGSEVDYNTLHAGEELVTDKIKKYAINIWFREKPSW